MSGLRERLIDSEWRCMFSPDEDAATIEAQKTAWPEDMARAGRRADAVLTTFRQWLEENGLVVVPREATEDMALVAIEGTQQAGYRKPTRTQVTVAHRWMCYAAPDVLGKP